MGQQFDIQPPNCIFIESEKNFLCKNIFPHRKGELIKKKSLIISNNQREAISQQDLFNKNNYLNFQTSNEREKKKGIICLR